MSDADLDSFFSELKELAESKPAPELVAPAEVAPPRDLLKEAAAEDEEAEAASAPPPPPKASTSVFAPRSLKPNVLSRPAVISKPPMKAAPPPVAVAAAPVAVAAAPTHHLLPPALYHVPAPMMHHGFHPAPPMAYYDIMAGGMGAAGAAAAGGGGAGVSAPTYPPSSSAPQQAQPPPSKPSLKRSAAGETWVDPTLADWPANDYRLFVANLGPEASEDILAAAFSKYRTFAKCRVVKPKIGQGGQGKVKPYGFVSFIDPWDALAALKEMDGAYIGSRPCSLRKSNWESRGAEGGGGGGGGGKKPRV